MKIPNLLMNGKVKSLFPPFNMQTFIYQPVDNGTLRIRRLMEFMPQTFVTFDCKMDTLHS